MPNSWCECVSNKGCCRHAFGDQYRATDIPIPGPGKLELVYHPQGGGEPQHFEVHNFDGKGALSAYARALWLLFLQPYKHPAISLVNQIHEACAVASS